MSISPPKRPAADHGLHSQQVFERKGRAYPLARRGVPSATAATSAAPSSDRATAWALPLGHHLRALRPAPRSSGTTVRTPRSDVETSRVTGEPWRALPAELCALKPP
eukprot:CAMPEP_0118809460 /NCGR_PEP_ID=MMETSP1162-20130426/288_1 /TAXON_ID=33656 /ORGANISM="Phaeocystis Sp, Strain CCMP2710" /LENGTH=106 /DNA_ID=CAMNT_0006738893 /DNA_START=31 /DNA_END=349 /DNA_ORIENTATION=-